MFRKLLDQLEIILEPQIDSSQYISHYTPSLVYKKLEPPVVYMLEINEETHLGDYVVANNYTQELKVELLYKASNGDYNFKIQTITKVFDLDKTLSQQGKLLEDLAQLTQEVDLVVTKNGSIKSVNHETILKKWQALKKELLRKHQGNQANAYINGIEAKLKNEPLFLEELKQVKIFGLLFNDYQAIHLKDKPKFCRISNVINCLPVRFKEAVINVEENTELGEKHISITGSMETIKEDTKERMKKYFKYFGIGRNYVSLSNYKRDLVLDLATGYPKSVSLNFELLNGNGYIKKQSFNLKMKNNG
jgi:hypothetical protein